MTWNYSVKQDAIRSHLWFVWLDVKIIYVIKMNRTPRDCVYLVSESTIIYGIYDDAMRRRPPMSRIDDKLPMAHDASKLTINYNSSYDATRLRLTLVRKDGKLLLNLLQHDCDEDKLPPLLCLNETASSTSQMAIKVPVALRLNVTGFPIRPGWR